MVVLVVNQEVAGVVEMMVVEVETEWGNGQGSRDWVGCVVSFFQKRYLLPKV